MESGKLNKRVEIQRATKTDDASGTPVETWAKLADVWAQLKPLRAREIVQEGQVQGDLTHQIRIRYYRGLTRKDRIKFGTRIFNLVEVINVDERGQMHELLAKESV